MSRLSRSEITGGKAAVSGARGCHFGVDSTGPHILCVILVVTSLDVRRIQ
jgi:hypothetical protein